MDDVSKRAADLARDNRAIEARIGRMGFETTNVRENQVVFLVDYLVKMGVFAEQAAQNFHLTWEQHLNDTLVGLELKARQALEDMRREKQRARNGSNIVTPGRRLFLPGDPGRSGGTGKQRPPQPESQ